MQKSLGLLQIEQRAAPERSYRAAPSWSYRGKTANTWTCEASYKCTYDHREYSNYRCSGGRGGQIYIKNLKDNSNSCWRTQELIGDYATIGVSGLTPGSLYWFQLMGENAREVHIDATTTGEPPKKLTKNQQLRHDRNVLLPYEMMEILLLLETLPLKHIELIMELGKEWKAWKAFKAAGKELEAVGKEKELEAVSKRITEIVEEISAETTGNITTYQVPAAAIEAVHKLMEDMVTEQWRKIEEDKKRCHFEEPI